MKLEFYIKNQEEPITTLSIIEQYLTQKRYDIVAAGLRRVFTDLVFKNVKIEDIVKITSV